MIRISEEIKKALKNNKPVVALESTIIAHGMPYPQNIETALNVEKIVRENGAIPATIGIIDGIAVIGMNEKEIEEFGRRPNILKVSRRDLPVVMSQKLWGATTVATTMIFAAMAGIEVFVTGGIGGVHRNAPFTFDISADLQELAHTNVTVVCSGAKAILDLPLTVEYLETFGIPLLGYQTSELAAFYCRSSGLNVDYQMDNALDVARAIKCKRDLKLNGGMVVSNPIPAIYSMKRVVIEKLIEDALESMKAKNIQGKQITPYLLKVIKEASKGQSLEANIHLIYNNAKVGALIAKELCQLI